MTFGLRLGFASSLLALTACGGQTERSASPRPSASDVAARPSASDPVASVSAGPSASASPSAAPSVAASATPPPAKPKKPTPDDFIAIHVGVAPPDGFALDGSLAEWKDAACDQPPTEEYDAPAKSCVVAAFDAKEITIAARVVGDTDGVWFRITDPAENEIPIPEDVFKAGYTECTVKDSRCAVSLDLKRKVGRTYHLTTKAIAAGADDTSARNVPSAKVVAVKGAGGVTTIEAKLPASELPWFACKSGSTWGVAGFGPKVDKVEESRWMASAREGWERVDPYADVRQMVGRFGFNDKLGIFRLGSTTTTMCSAQASTVSCTDIPTLESDVSNDKMSVGIVRIWKNDALRPAAVVRIAGSPRLDQDYESDPIAVVKRGDDIDVIRFNHQCPGGGPCLGAMFISRVTPDGSMGTAPSDGDDERLWATVSAYHDAGWKEFGLHGTDPDNPKRAVDLHFTYDEAANAYHAKLIK